MQKQVSEIFLTVIPIAFVTIAMGIIFYLQWQERKSYRPAYDEPGVVQKQRKLVDANQHIPTSETWQLVEVLSGDTIRAKKGWRKQTIRLCGIDAPDSPKNQVDESKAYLEKLLEPSPEEMFVIPHGRDRQGRLIGEIFISANTVNPIEEVFINYEMVQAKHAKVYEEFVLDCLNGDSFYP